MKKVIVGRNIKILNPSKEFRNTIKNELNIVNPTYLQLEAMNKNTWGIPRHYQAFSVIGDDYVIPFGAVSNKKILKHLKGYKYEVLDHEQYKVYLSTRVKPFDYQERAIRHVIDRKLHRGIIVGGTGSGKTNVGLYIIKELGLRALWITHTSDLLRQSRDRAKSVFNNVDVGYITEGKIDIGKDITFATVQTLVNVIDEVKDLFNVVIVDEAHHCVGSPTLVTMFYKVMNNLHAEYKFGLTATPKRSDGLEQMSYALLGEVAYEIPKSDVSARILPIKYDLIYNNSQYDVFNYTTSAGMVDPHKLLDMINSDESRNKLIVDNIEKMSKSSHGILVLSKRVNHCELLAEMIRERGINVGLLTGKSVTKKGRKEILESDDIQVIVATNSLAKEGLDLVRYDTLILTYNVGNKNEFTQSAGRVRRVNGDKKKFGYVYEVCDTNIGYLQKRTNKHRKWAKEL